MSAEDSSKITFVVPGFIVDSPTAAIRAGGAAAPRGLAGAVKASVRVGSMRAGGEVQRLQAIPGEDIVVLHISKGPTLFLHPENARDLLAAQAGATRGAKAADAGEVDVPIRLQWRGLRESQGVSRSGGGGLGDVALEAIDIVTGHLKEKAAEIVAGQLAARIDGQVAEGVYRLKQDALKPLKGTPMVATLPDASEGPALVFVHGTFSSTESGFRQFWTQHPQSVRGLFKHYGDRVFALDHRTLQASPIENALNLVRKCGKGARLHLVTHSRGGLVAEVLVRAGALQELHESDADFFQEPSRAAQKRDLEELVKLMSQKDIRVDRVVRVACPARGTLLASERLDAYLSIFKWGLELAQLPILPDLVDFLAAVAQTKADPTVLPGLEVMMPDSPLIKWLHAADAPIQSDLRVIAGDLQGDSIGSWVKALTSDAFFWTDNDLVVQTRSMYGGAPRRAGATFVLDRGGKVTHFNYFGNERTANALVTGLTQDIPDGFRTIGPLSYAGESESGTRAAQRATRAAARGKPAEGKPAVFVLPGILGSHIKVDGQRVWLDLRLFNGLERLKYSEPPRAKFEPDGSIGMVYQDLLDFLDESHQAIEFSFDWRRPIEHEAERLADAISAALDAREKNGLPVRIVAHSMGGLVARALQLQRPKVWDRMMGRRGARLLMLGTPNAGSWAPMQVLSGDDTFGNVLTAFGAPFQDHTARTVMAGLPGLMQLQAALLDPQTRLGDAETWEKIAAEDVKRVKENSIWHYLPIQLKNYEWGLPPQEVLDRAVTLRRKLDAQARDVLPKYGDRLLLVAGQAEFTPDGYEIGDDGLEYLNSRGGGDGRVTIASAMLSGVPTWRLDAAHGDLPGVRKAFDAYRELLETGATAQLPQTRADLVRAQDAAAKAAHVRSRPARQLRSGSIPPESVDALNTQGAGFDGAGASPAAAPLDIIVHNGDVKFVREPLMIGHYRSASLTGVEKQVNWLIGGAMDLSLNMGQYPDEPGTHQLFLNRGINRDNPFQAPRPETVIVVGLGEEGKLKPADLAYSVKLGVIALAQQIYERDSDAPGEFEFAATLLGSGGANITPGQAAILIAQGTCDADLAIADANARVSKQDTRANAHSGGDQRPWPRVARLHLIEQYMDRATEAWRALRIPMVGGSRIYHVDEVIAPGQGALKRPLQGGYRGAEYDFISAIAESSARDGERIIYALNTKRARSEIRAQSTQARLVRELVEQASNHENNDRQIGRTLFQLLVPEEMEPYISGASEMVLELNSGAAGIPWELLDTRREKRVSNDDKPWAIRTKLLRKLRLQNFRLKPIDANADARVLVIGEPAVAADRYPRLPAAREEAKSVRDLLRRVLQTGVADLISPDDELERGPDAREVINKLMSDDWRVVHISGHGEPPENVGSRTADDQDAQGGVVLSNGTFLGPREIGAMRVVPELVFVNCCYLAARANKELFVTEREREYNRAKFAAGVAEKLIEIGVRCVVAAGWAVDDVAAKVFATTFYERLALGARFAEAVAYARERAYEMGGNTWAAYQCYGDPDWFLRRGGADAQRPDPYIVEEFDDVASESALVLALGTIETKCRFDGSTDGATAQSDRIRHLEARFSERWGGAGKVAEAFARASEAAGDSEQAIAWYKQALEASDGRASLRASEQLANLRVRHAWRKFEEALAHLKRAKESQEAQETGESHEGRKPQPLSKNAVSAAQKNVHTSAGEARKAITAAIELIDKLLSLHATRERLNIRGSAYKRLAMVERDVGNGPAAAKALKEMEKAYGEAEALGRASGQTQDLFYPLLNRLAAEVAGSAGAKPMKWSAPGAVAETRKLLEARAAREPDFWSIVGLTELALLEALAASRLAGSVETIQAGYADLHARVKSPTYWRSVADQLSFLLPAYYERVKTEPERKAVEMLRAQVDVYTR